MSVSEYVLSLLAILSGLAVTDMVTSLHGLLRRFGRVRWDFLPVAAALLVFAVIVGSWWISWHSPWDGVSYLRFTLVLCQMIGLFLAAKAVLPDDDGGEAEVDLLEHYRRRNRYVWLAAITPAALMPTFALIAVVAGEPVSILLDQWPYFAQAAALLILIFVQRMIIHRVMVPALLVTWVALFAGLTMSAAP